MKRILCFVFSALMLFSVFAVFASAENATELSVMQELAQLQIDGVPFSQLKDTKFPVNAADKGLYIITCVEKGFRDKSSTSQFELYFYIYNPSCMELKEDVRNSIQIGVGDDFEDVSFYAFKKYSASSDNRFIKIGLTNSQHYSPYSLCCSNQSDINRRVYNVGTLRFVINGKLEAFSINRAYLFEGFDFSNSLKSYWQNLDALEVELHSTNWISPNAGYKVDGKTEATIYDHYEINSVYFSIPRAVYDNYDYLKSIRAEYDALHLTPIVVTRPGDFNNVTKDAILYADTIWKDADGDGENDLSVDVMNLYWQVYLDFFGDNMEAFLYSESDYLRDLAEVDFLWVDRNAQLPNSLAYYFEALPENFDYEDGSQLLKAVVSAEELEAYFYERYNDRYFDKLKLYTERVHQIMDYYTITANDKAMYNMRTYDEVTAEKGWFDRVIRKMTTQKDSYTWEDFATQANHIDVIKYPSNYASVSSGSYEKIANELFIGVNDVKDFSAFCAEAVRKNEVVILLRFGFSDYRMAPIESVSSMALGVGSYCGVVVDKWAYMNFSLANMVFCKDGENHVVPVSSNVVDSFGDLDIGGDPAINNSKEFWENVGGYAKDFWDAWTNFLLWIGVALAVFVVLMIVVRLLRKKEKKESVTINLIDPGPGGGGGSFWRRRRKREK